MYVCFGEHLEVRATRANATLAFQLAFVARIQAWISASLFGFWSSGYKVEFRVLG